MRGLFIGVAVQLIVYDGSAAAGDVYQWQDEQGVIHFTDNAEKIPSRFRGKVLTRESVGGEEGVTLPSPVPHPQAAPPPRPKGDPLYGGRPAGWWQTRFTAVRTELSTATAALEQKRSELQRAHRAYRVSLGAAQGADGEPKGYALNTIGAKRKAYYDLKDEVPKLEEKVKEIEARLSAITAEADSAGVPPEAR